MITDLLERDGELVQLRALLAAARDGRGGIALVEGPAGAGKTSLLRALRSEATGMRVLSAVGAELEREFAYGLVRQLVDASPVLDSPALDGCQTRLHGLYSLIAGMADDGPLVVFVDDAHWGDDGSLKALGMLAARIEQLPIALVIGLRPDVRPCLHALFTAPRAVVLRPAPLSVGAVASLVAGAVDGDAAAEFVAAATEATGGNPLLVRELERTLAAEAFSGCASEVERVRRAVPGSIARLVQGRLWRLPPAAVALARAVAALGDRATVALVNALAGLEEGVAANAHVSLAAVGLLEPGALRFIHPMMREATLAGLVPATRSGFHRRAALLLHTAGAREEEIAAQFLAAEPGSDPCAAAVLLCTGQRALAAGDSEVALTHLQRALAEGGPKPELLLALGMAEARAGGAGALMWLSRAASVDEPLVAARAQQALARVLVLAGRPREAAEALDAGRRLALGVDEALAAQLEDDLLDGLNDDAGLAVERRARLKLADRRPVVLAHRAFDLAAAGGTAEEVRGLALRALASGALVAAPERPAAQYAIEALMAVEAAAEARAAIDALADAARTAGSRVGAGGVALLLTRWEHEFGHLETAQDAAVAAIDLQVGFSGAPPAQSIRSGLAAAVLDAGTIVDAARPLIPGGRARGWAPPAGAAGAEAGAGRLAAARGIEAGAGRLAAARGVEAGEGRLAAAHREAGAGRLAAVDALAAARAAWQLVVLAEVPRGRGGALSRSGVPAAAGPPIGAFDAVRGRVLLALGRVDEAIEELELQLALDARRGWAMTFREPTRATLVEALGEAGRFDEARALAARELAVVRARGLHGAEARLLLACARLTVDEIPLLRLAREAARRSPVTLVQAEAAAALGAALRRAGKRADARGPLREARELALRAGAHALEARAHEELLIAGARPRRVTQAGVEGLTPSERRVAELAATGRRNREIAELLVVTMKTVEVHLGRAYGKLGIDSRSQLAAALA